MLSATSAATTAAAVPPRQNGQAVKDASGVNVADTSMDTTMAYQPNTTFYDDEEEEEEGQPKPSLEEEIQQLDQHYTSAQQNHISSSSPAHQKGAAPASGASTAQKQRSKGRGICCILSTSVFVGLVLFGVTFYVLYFSGLEHPYLTEARDHLQFLEPTRDFVATKASDIADYFRQ
nr:hypothetical protein BaRGS_029990 [Batillaria attramentaria]